MKGLRRARAQVRQVLCRRKPPALQCSAGAHKVPPARIAGKANPVFGAGREQTSSSPCRRVGLVHPGTIRIAIHRSDVKGPVRDRSCTAPRLPLLSDLQQSQLASLAHLCARRHQVPGGKKLPRNWGNCRVLQSAKDEEAFPHACVASCPSPPLLDPPGPFRRRSWSCSDRSGNRQWSSDACQTITSRNEAADGAI